MGLGRSSDPGNPTQPRFYGLVQVVGLVWNYVTRMDGLGIEFRIFQPNEPNPTRRDKILFGFSWGINLFMILLFLWQTRRPDPIHIHRSRVPNQTQPYPKIVGLGWFRLHEFLLDNRTQPNPIYFDWVGSQIPLNLTQPNSWPPLILRFGIIFFGNHI